VEGVSWDCGRLVDELKLSSDGMNDRIAEQVFSKLCSLTSALEGKIEEINCTWNSQYY
jgi:hypothetical protein